MKKDVLFIMNNLNCGGAEKALLSLLETIDYSRYNVDLFLFKHEGIFLKKLPEQVNLLSEPTAYKFFDMPIKAAVTGCLKEQRYKVGFWRLFTGYLFKTEKNSAKCEQRAWRYLSKVIEDINKSYDTAIGYLEKNPVYFCIDKVKAIRKIGWIHTDYNKLGMTASYDKPYFAKLDNIVTVSEELVKLLKGIFPECEKKISCIYNIVSPEIIRKLSLENIENDIYDEKSIKLISVGRLASEKGLDITLEAINLLIKKGLNIKWYLMGAGNMESDLKRMVSEKKIGDKVIFLGLKENPYPYIRHADIYIQSSKFEGKSISIDEAKILGKPIIITNFRTAKNHICDNVNGLIAEMDPVSVANKIELLINTSHLKNKFTKKLFSEENGTEAEITKFYNLIEK
ncbi:glycosyltransferase [Pseudalkalibacillus hwajinpoensis]|uniref:glycosyltransferase n=1 Tax=Guptibacillus hwajinpoensis TaxID=208199 RepID=UPI00325B295F